MFESIKAHLAFYLVFGMCLGVGALCLFTGQIFYAFLVCLFLVFLAWLRVRDHRRNHQVKDLRSVLKASGLSGYTVQSEGERAMRAHLREHPDDFEVALTLARSLSSYRCEADGRQAYELACRGALKSDMRRALEILREYLAKYLKPFDHALTVELALLAEQYGDRHFATQGLEAVFNDPQAEPELARRSLAECIRICEALALHDAATNYRARLAATG